MSTTRVEGGVCAPAGFVAGALYSGIAKKQNKPDLALVYSKAPCRCAAVYTLNKVKAAPILVTRQNLEQTGGAARAIICNSGNANACHCDSERAAREICAAAAKELDIDPREVVVASTGVIGKPMPVEPVRQALPRLVPTLSREGSGLAADAIMTTDLHKKEIAVSFALGGKTCTVGGIAKGSGMIHPNMGTMLAFVCTDTLISRELLQRAAAQVTGQTFNMVSVDGDTSTNDMLALLANGLAGNPEITREGEDYRLFYQALLEVCTYLARLMAKDGEGATKLLECRVTGAPDGAAARILAKSVISSSLFKAAMFGEDANWGRILCALGYADTEFDPSRAEITLKSRTGELPVCSGGGGLPFSEEKAKEILHQDELEILVELRQGTGSAVAWGCDLSYDYVKINGDYRS